MPGVETPGYLPAPPLGAFRLIDGALPVYESQYRTHYYTRYLIVGAHAVAFHVRPRATKDLDIFIEATPDNAERVLERSEFSWGAVWG